MYGSEQEFVDAILPFVRAGVEAEEPVLVAVQAANVAALRESLNGEADGVELCRVEEWYETAARTRSKFAAWVSEHANGGRVRLVGEPPWLLQSAAGVREWARHESVLNVAFADLPLSSICPYDSRALPAQIIEYAEHTHPVLRAPDGVSASASFVEAHDLCARLNAQARLPTELPEAELELDAGSIAKVRHIVELIASEAALGEEKVGDIVLAVSEVATNAVRHGRPPARMRLWHHDGELICAVSDAGSGVVDPLAGQLEPDPTTPGGWGLWIARTVADAVETRCDGDPATVAVHVGL